MAAGGVARGLTVLGEREEEQRPDSSTGENAGLTIAQGRRGRGAAAQSASLVAQSALLRRSRRCGRLLGQARAARTILLAQVCGSYSRRPLFFRNGAPTRSLREAA